MITAVICFCTNDYRYLGLCVDALKDSVDEILIVVGDRFFNGDPEKKDLLDHVYQEFKHCRFVEFHCDLQKPYGFTLQRAKVSPQYWHSSARYLGFLHVHPQTEYVLFLDTDEIADSSLWTSWLKSFPYQEYQAIRFSSYFYYKEPFYRAKIQHDRPLWIKKSCVLATEILDPQERFGLFQKIQGTKATGMCFQKNPIFHHYSWVKPQKEILKKVQTWGHREQRDWISLVDEFTKPFQGKDPLWGFDYDRVTPLHDPLGIRLPQKLLPCLDKSHVVHTNPKEALLKDF